MKNSSYLIIGKLSVGLFVFFLTIVTVIGSYQGFKNKDVTDYWFKIESNDDSRLTNSLAKMNQRLTKVELDLDEQSLKILKNK